MIFRKYRPMYRVTAIATGRVWQLFSVLLIECQQLLPVIRQPFSVPTIA